MTLFDVLTMIGGLCLFLFGMNAMGQALERRAGGKLRSILGKLTKNKAAGFFTGMGVTAIIQSSSATTVMVVGFVNSGIMTLRQAISVIMGANVGTTVTAWILSLGGIQSDNFVLQLLKPTSFTPILAVIGIIFYMFCKSSKKNDTGMILLGFATLMFGMDTMSSAVSGLADVPEFTSLFTMFQNPVLGVLAGALLTAIIQSSSASVGILQALAVTGAVTYGAAIPIIMGQNIGTCITAILSSVGANKNAKRAALVHLSFNVIGTLVWLMVFCAVTAFIDIPLMGEAASLPGIAISHSAFNILCTILLLPMSGILEKLALKLIPDAKFDEETATLDERLLATPPIALERCKSVVTEMGDITMSALKSSIDVLNKFDADTTQVIRDLEDKTDRYEDMISSYLIKLSGHHQLSASDALETTKMLKMIGDFERISDHSVNIIESAEEMNAKDIVFTPAAKEELGILTNAVIEIVTLAQKAFHSNELEAALKIEPLEQVIDDLKEELRSSHIKRLQQNECSVEAGFVWSDLLNNLERVSDHCSNIAGCIIESASSQQLTAPDGLRDIRYDSAEYFDAYKKYLAIYSVKK